AVAATLGFEHLEELDLLVRDLEAGLIDFPALRDGREGYLCWQGDENEVGHRHAAETGYPSRPPLEPRAQEPVEEFRCARCGAPAASRASHAAHGPEGRIASAAGPSHWRLHHIGRTDHSSTNSRFLLRSQLAPRHCACAHSGRGRRAFGPRRTG